MIKTYIHVNDHEPISCEPLSPPSATFSKFKNNSMNQENNYSASGFVLNQENNFSTSGFVSNNSPFNSPAKLTSLKSPITLFSSVSPHHKLELHLDSNIVFPSLLPLSISFTHPLKIDSTSSDSEFEDLLLYFVYGSPFTPSSPISSNSTIDSPIASKRFTEFHRQSIHVFSSPSSFYYSLQPTSKSH
jgi:hypothetical protein